MIFRLPGSIGFTVVMLVSQLALTLAIASGDTVCLVSPKQLTQAGYMPSLAPAPLMPGDVLKLVATRDGEFLVELGGTVPHRFWIPDKRENKWLVAERRGQHVRMLNQLSLDGLEAVYLFHPDEQYLLLNDEGDEWLVEARLGNEGRLALHVPAERFSKLPVKTNRAESDTSEEAGSGYDIQGAGSGGDASGGATNSLPGRFAGNLSGSRSRTISSEDQANSGDGQSSRQAANEAYAEEIAEHLRTMPLREIAEVKVPATAVCTITTPDGAGTGFLLEMDGRVYCVTNHHVIGTAPDSLIITDLEQRVYEALFIEVAEDRDLARILVAPQLQALKEVSAPGLGDSVVVLGNSQGTSIITQIEGKVVGMGSGLVELDAGFVPGNSGSPVVDEETGAVIGVATFVFRMSEDTDWITKGTRFEDARRIATRLDDTVEWIAISPDILRLVNKGFLDLELFTLEGAALLSDFLSNPLDENHIGNLSSNALKPWAERGNALRRQFRRETNAYMSRRNPHHAGLQDIQVQQFHIMASHINSLLPVCGQKLSRLPALTSGPPRLTYWEHKAERAKASLQALIEGCKLSTKILQHAENDGS